MSANTTPDATATPRSGVPDAEYWKAHYERIERELTAAKAEIARLTNLGWFGKYHKAAARVAELEANGTSEAFVTMSVRASTAEQKVAELEKERTEWSVIYRRDYGHDWSTRGNYKGF